MNVERDVIEAAVAAASRARFEAVRAGLGGVGVPTRTYDELSDRTRRIQADQIRPTVEAAYPVIAAAVRAQVAEETAAAIEATTILPVQYDVDRVANIATRIDAEIARRAAAAPEVAPTERSDADGLSWDEAGAWCGTPCGRTFEDRDTALAHIDKCADCPQMLSTVDRVRAAARSMLGWCDDPTADPTILGSILAPLVRSVAAKPVDEVACPACGAHTRARMSDVQAQVASKKRTPLTFDEFSKTNAQRCARWHPGFPTEDSWTLADWSNALCGEAGELANVVKKIRRIETSHFSKRADEQDRVDLVRKAGDEIGDVMAYLDLLATKLGLRVDVVTAAKFNAISEREGYPERIPAVPVAAPTDPADWQAIAAGAVEALRLTREYVGEKTLPAWPGWSWFDATNRYRAAAGLPELPAEPAAGQFTAGEVVCVRCGRRGTRGFVVSSGNGDGTRDTYACASSTACDRRGTDLPEIAPPNGDLLEALERSLVQARGDGLPPDTGEEH